MCRGVRLENQRSEWTLLCFASVKHGKDLSSVPRARSISLTLSRPCMKRICHGADACHARVYMCFCIIWEMQRRPTQFSQPETASCGGDSCAPSWASTQTRVTLVELKCKLKSFWQNIHYCAAHWLGISRAAHRSTQGWRLFFRFKICKFFVQWAEFSHVFVAKKVLSAPGNCRKRSSRVISNFYTTQTPLLFLYYGNEMEERVRTKQLPGYQI